MSEKWFSWRLVFRNEARVLFADRTLWLLIGLLLSLTGYALFNGMIETGRRDHAVQGILERQRQGESARVAQWHRIMEGTETPTPFASPVDPSSMASGFGARYAVLPTLALAPIAVGQSDLFPPYYQVTNANKGTFIYDSEMENPWHLLSGHFDLSFVVVYLSLLILAVSYNLLSAEREQGTLKMLLSQPVGLRAVIVGKVAIRAAVILTGAVIIPIVVLLAAQGALRDAGQVEPLLMWALIVCAYAMFWFSLAVAVNALGKSSAANALILIATWVVFVLVAPVALNLLVSVLSPSPSRTELATRTRLATIETLDRYADLLSADYEYTDKPELLLPKDGKIEIAGRLRAFHLSDKDVDERLRPVLETFRSQNARQQILVGRVGAASPAVVAYERVVALAGNGTRRYLRYQEQVDAFHESWRAFFGPRILGGLAITQADFGRLPEFVWKEEDRAALRADVVLGLVELIVPTAFLIALAGYRLRSYPTV